MIVQPRLCRITDPGRGEELQIIMAAKRHLPSRARTCAATLVKSSLRKEPVKCTHQAREPGRPTGFPAFCMSAVLGMVLPPGAPNKAR
jgi:hypothetical protein